MDEFQQFGRERGRGHANLDVTMTIYAHTSLEDMREALRKLGEHLN